MYLIILLSVTLWRPFGGCYLFAVETPRGSIQPIRDCCSVNSPLTSSGWAWLLFKSVSFVVARSSNLRVTDSPGWGLMALLYAPHHAGWSLRRCLSLKGGGCPCLQKQRKRGRIRRWERCWRKDALLSLAAHLENEDDNVNDPRTGSSLWGWIYLLIQGCLPSMSIIILVFSHVANFLSQHKLYSHLCSSLWQSVNSLQSDMRQVH